jgi:phospholipid/cholesterol/gamma-HCH transport system substrate-binding protein
MTVAAPPVPAAAPTPPSSPAPVRAPRSWTWRLLAFGALLVLVLASVVTVVFESFGGAFSTFAVVDAQLPLSSTAVALNAPVEYRNVTVGTVASQGRSVPGGMVLVTLHMQVSKLHLIPAGVRATETPVSFFGDAYIVLEPPANPGTATLKAGATISALEVGATASLQTTLGDLDNLLIELHPGQLDAALTALAGAIQGQGTSLGKNFVKGNNYFQQMLPLWPTVVANLKTLVPVANQFASSTPDILSILANQTVTAKTINSRATEIRQAIGGGATLAKEATELLTAIQQPYNILTADSAPFLQDISQNPNEISQLLQGLYNWAKAWTSAESSGPYLDLTADVVVANPADLGLAVLGGPEVESYLADGLGPGYVNPATYTSAASIPSDSTTSEVSAPSLAAALSSAPVMAEPAQATAISQIISAMNGSKPASTAVSTLLLSPLLEGLVNRG